MKTDWALGELDEFVRLTESRNGSGNGVITMRSYAIYPRIDVLAQWAVVKPILDVVHPNWQAEHSEHESYEFGQRRDAAIHARSLMKRAEEIRENLKPIGPVLPAEELHPVIWDPASLLWSNKHVREAVQAASTTLNIKLQNFTGRFDVSGRTLALQSFSDKPPSVGEPRIRVPQQADDETTRSLQQGMRALGEACFAVVRNPSTHQLEDLSEQEGLERLAVLSLFVRILETCTVEGIATASSDGTTK